MDLGAQEEFADNFWCFWKMRCSTLYFSASEMYIFGFWGSARPKPSLTNPKTGQNELKRLNLASAEGLRCLGGPADPPIDMSCLWTRSELFGMGNLAVTSVWQMCDKLFVTHLSHIGHIGFRPSWGEKLQKQNCTIEIDTMLTQCVVWIWFRLLWDRIPLQNVWQTVWHSLAHIWHTEFSTFWSMENQKQYCFTEMAYYARPTCHLVLVWVTFEIQVTEILARIAGTKRPHPLSVRSA